MIRNKRRPAKKKAKPVVVPQGIFTAHIEELLSDGRGFANVNGRPTMISGALPDEHIEFTYHNQKKQFLEGSVTHIIKPSPDRTKPRCEAFDVCGGCSLQHLEAEQQILFKQQQLESNLRKQAKIKPKSFEKPLVAEHWGYRRRARVGIKQIGNSIHVGFRGKNSSHIVPLSGCEVLAPKLSELFNPIAELIKGMSCPDKIPQVEMALGDNTLALSFRHMCSLTIDDTQRFEKFGQEHNISIYLQPDDSSSVSGLNHETVINYELAVQTSYDLEANILHKPLLMDFLPYHFTQINFDVNERMVTQALDWLDVTKDDDILDLFCGLGNFSLPLAQRANSVVGIEGLQSLVQWAQKNANNNGIENVDFYQADLTHDTRMMSWRVKRSYNKVLIDPPRAGALDIMPLINEIRPESICYVSCHAATLARDMDTLVNKYGYRLIKCGVMDMFPHTAHVESMVLLKRSGCRKNTKNK
ncbi:MAG: 23S rRNA (uracil(1939)-C(5))-methyltransferase RlmD [Gammaproteobacteria bacterium]|nr:23S rRNA (uracil(1939)-C(5))-methyltransferase RlmD [Gammaproteobacteria bacterium]